MDKTGRINYRGISLLQTSCIKQLRFIQDVIEYTSLQVKSIYKMKFIGINSVNFDVTDELLIRIFIFVIYLIKVGVH
jgi:hypothetical protein